MQTLLIWEMIPEDTTLFLIPDVGDWVEEAHNCFINGAVNTEAQSIALKRINDALVAEIDFCQNPSDPLVTKWAKYRIPSDEIPILNQETRIVVSGFYL